MPVEMALWRVDGSSLHELALARLDQERRLEDWIAADPSLIGMQMAVIARQVRTGSGGRIDILGLDGEGNLLVLELKRDRTPREVIAQLLDYGSWVRTLDFGELDRLSQDWQSKNLAAIFEEAFGGSLPETVNSAHSLILVASELDDSSDRIINYLAEEYEVSINALFFRFFQDGGGEFLGRAWLRDPVETFEQAESRHRAPWGGEWFVNVGEGPHRTWEDNRRYGFIGAGQGDKYSRPLQKLRVGDKIFAYMKGHGYVGYGAVTTEAVPIRQFVVEELSQPLLELALAAPRPEENSENPTLSEWVVGVGWLKTFSREEARTFTGAFANQNIVCKLRHADTLSYLHEQFDIQGA